MNLKGFHGCYWLVLLALALYIPLVCFGGFGTSDDLSLVAHIGSSYLTDLKYSLMRSGHISRPIYGFVQTSSLHLFGSSFVLYNVFRLTLWGLVIYLSKMVFTKLIGNKVSLLFLFFLSFPIFASSQLFNGLQTGYLLSIIFYLLALNSIQDNQGKFQREAYKSYFIWSLLALLSCEIVFPLFLFPILQVWNKNGLSKGIRTLFLTTILVFVILLVLKFFIGPIYQIGPDVYGFSFSLHSVLQGVYYFFAVFVEVPLLLLEVIPFFFSEPILWLSFLAIPIVYWSKAKLTFEFDQKMLLNIGWTISSCSLIFVLSDYPAVTYGLYNKMLLPSHVFVALALSIFCAVLLRSKFYLVTYVIAILWLASMQMQVVNTIRSWDTRESVYHEITPILNRLETKEVSVFVEAPYFLESNYNNEPVFSLIDDFQGGLLLKGFTGNVSNVFPYTSRMVLDRSYWSNHNLLNVIDSKGIVAFSCVHSKWCTSSVDLTRHKKMSIASFLSSHPFHKQLECKRAELRAWLSHKFIGK